MTPREMTNEERVAFLTEMAAQLRIGHSKTTQVIRKNDGPSLYLSLQVEGFHLPVIVHFNRKQSDRVEFVSAWDHPDGNHWPSRGPGVSISASVARGPVAIAADFARRFLPDFREWCDRAAEERKRHEEYHAAKDAAIARLAQAFGYDPPKDRDNFHFYYDGKGYGDVRVNSNTADLALHALSVDVAEKILTLLKELIRGTA